MGASVFLSGLNWLSNPSSPSFALRVNSFICAVFFSSLSGLMALWGLFLSSSFMSWHSPDPCCRRCFSQPSVWLSISSRSLSHCFYIFLGPFFTEMCHCSLFFRLTSSCDLLWFPRPMKGHIELRLARHYTCDTSFDQRPTCWEFTNSRPV